MTMERLRTVNIESFLVSGDYSIRYWMDTMRAILLIQETWKTLHQDCFWQTLQNTSEPNCSTDIFNALNFYTDGM